MHLQPWSIFWIPSILCVNVILWGKSNWHFVPLCFKLFITPKEFMDKNKSVSFFFSLSFHDRTKWGRYEFIKKKIHFCNALFCISPMKCDQKLVMSPSRAWSSVPWLELKDFQLGSARDLFTSAGNWKFGQKRAEIRLLVEDPIFDYFFIINSY